MQPQKKTVRAPVPQGVLVKWTFVSALLHFACIGGLCYSSHLQSQVREAALKAKSLPDSADPADSTSAAPRQSEPASPNPTAPAAQNAESTQNASSPSQPATATNPAAVQNPQAQKPAEHPPTGLPTQKQPPDEKTSAENSKPSAEKILGIDKVAKPEDAPKGANPFSGKDDDLLKDLK